MTSEKPPSQRSSPDDHAPDTAPQQRSRLMFIIAFLVLLTPAGIPLYFALRMEDGRNAILFFALAAGVVLVNILLLVALWNWLQSLRS